MKRGRPRVTEDSRPTWEKLFIAVQVVVDRKTKTEKGVEGISSESRVEAIKRAVEEANAWIAEQENKELPQEEQETSAEQGKERIGDTEKESSKD